LMFLYVYFVFNFVPRHLISLYFFYPIWSSFFWLLLFYPLHYYFFILSVEFNLILFGF
jgi:hypothetical protein